MCFIYIRNENLMTKNVVFCDDNIKNNVEGEMGEYRLLNLLKPSGNFTYDQV
jgi:hypothetical protein